MDGLRQNGKGGRACSLASLFEVSQMRETWAPCCLWPDCPAERQRVQLWGGIAWLGSSRRSLHMREYPFRAPANPHRIGRAACLENHRPKDGIYTTGVLPQSTLRRHTCSWRADSCA